MPTVGFAVPTLEYCGPTTWMMSLMRHFQSIRTVGCWLAIDSYDPAVIQQVRKFTDVLWPREMPPEIPDVLLTWGLGPVLGRVREWFPPGKQPFIIDVSHGSAEWAGANGSAKVSAMFADALVAVSETALTAFEGVENRQKHIIYNGAESTVAQPRFSREDVRSQLGIPEDRYLCLYIGRLTAVKRVDAIVEAMSKCDDCHALIVGSGPSDSWIRKVVRDANVGDRVHFAEPTSWVADLYSAADLFVLPSRCEGMPMVALEAFLAGIPVLTVESKWANELTSTPDIYIYASKRIDGIADSICFVRDDRERCLEFVASNRRIAATRFSAVRMAWLWEQFIAECLQRRSCQSGSHDRMREILKAAERVDSTQTAVANADAIPQRS